MGVTETLFGLMRAWFVSQLALDAQERSRLIEEADHRRSGRRGWLVIVVRRVGRLGHM